MKHRLLPGFPFSACGRLWAVILLLTHLGLTARAQAPSVAVAPAGPFTLCPGGSQTLTATATLPGFNAGGSGFNNVVTAVTVQPDGKILVGGNFTSYNGNAAAPDYLVRLNADGSLDAGFNAGGSGFNQQVDDIAVQPDGKILVAGNFWMYNGNDAGASDRMLRLNADGSLDTSFNAGGSGLDGAATEVAVQPDGKIVVLSYASSYNGNAALPDRVHRFNADGSIDASFNPGGTGIPGVSVFLYALVLQPDGKILIGGLFTSYNGNAAAPDNVLRINANGTLDTSFNTGGSGPDDLVSALALQPDGKVVVSGDFFNFNGAACPDKVIRLTASGTLDASFNPGGAGATGFGFSNAYALALQPDGKILVGGLFTTYNGNLAAPDCILRLNPDGLLDTGFNAGGSGANNIVYALALQADNKILVGSRAVSYNGDAAAPDDLVRLNVDGKLDSFTASGSAVSYTWNTGATGPSITVSQPGLYQATAITSAGTAYSNVVTVNATPEVRVQVTPAGLLTLPFGGSQLLTATATTPGFNVAGSGFNGGVNAVLPLPDGKVLVGGNFVGYNGDFSAPDNILRLNADGTLDTSFNPGGSGTNNTVFALAVQPDGKVLVGGGFDSYNGNVAAPNNLLRLNADGSLDTSFNSGGVGVSGTVNALAAQPDGRILAGGLFTAYNGNAAAPNNLLRVNADGSLDGSFNNNAAGTNEPIRALALQADGRVLIGGNFTRYNGNITTSGFLLRLNTDGSLDTGFNTGGSGLNSAVNALAVQPDGKALVGGFFTSYNGSAAPGFVLRLNVDGSLDTGFNGSGSGANRTVYNLAVQSDGKVLVGGIFTEYNGSAAAPDGLMRLSSSGALDTGFNLGGTGLSGTISVLVALPGDKVLVGGGFTEYNGNAAAPDGLMRLNADGSLNDAAAALPGATFVFNPGATSGNTRRVTAAGSYTATATDPATGCAYTSAPVLVTVAAGDLIVSTGTPASPTGVAPGVYNTITVTGTGNAVLDSAAQVNGAVLVQDGGSLNLNCQPLTGSGSFTLAAGATLYICDPAGLSLTGPSGAIQVTGTRSFSNDASYIYNGTQAQITGTGLPARVRGLGTVNANALTLSQPLAVAQTLTVGASGNVALNGQPLTLLSDASGTALVVLAGTGAVTGSTATVQRYLDPSRNPGPGYRHYSSPVQGNTLADLATASFTPSFNPAYNTSATPGLVQPFPTVFGYEQLRLATVTSNYSAFDKGWFSPAATDAFQPGRGVTVNLAGTEKVDFTGTLTAGNLTLSLARNAASAANAADAGWHLVGNPYAAPLDWTAFTPADRPGLDAAMYVYESTSQYGGQYRSYVNGIGGGSPLIGTAQGFFVRVSSGQTSGQLSFRNAQRLTSFTAQVPVRRGAADRRPQLQLSLSGAGLNDQLYLYAQTGATADADPAYDAVKLVNAHGLNLAALSATGQPLAIDGRPGLTGRIALAVSVPAAGSYTIGADSLAYLADTRVELLDNLTGTRTLLTAGSRYRFSTSTTTAPGRFWLNLTPAAPLAAASAASAAQVLVYPNPAHDRLTVLRPAGGAAQATLLNALGQVVRQLPLPAAETTLDLHGLASGVYTLRLALPQGLVTRRIVVD